MSVIRKLFEKILKSNKKGTKDMTYDNNLPEGQTNLMSISTPE